VKLRFQADADLNESTVKGVPRREPLIDFKTATAARLRSLSDVEVLTNAAEEGRVLVAHDRKTMPRAFGDFIRCDSRIPEDRCFERDRIAGAGMWTVTEAAEFENRIFTIPL
jgi:hypothetical protein